MTNAPETPSAQTPRTEGLRRMLAVATRPPYSWYLLGQAADTIALWMQRLALGWLVWELTGSAAWLGAISFLKFAPTMLLGLFGGVLADRFPRGHIVLAGQAVTVFQSTAMAVLIVTGGINLPILVALTLMVGVAVGLSQAASKTVVNELVPRADVPAAIALNSVIFTVSQLVGPAIAGLVLVFLGNVACFAAVGPGEVVVGDAKVVGISQRRTRELARFQTVAYLDWEAAELLDLLAPGVLPASGREALERRVRPVGGPVEDLIGDLLGSLPS